MHWLRKIQKYRTISHMCLVYATITDTHT